MKFCQQCSSIMTKLTLATGEITFQCQCHLSEKGLPDDTLMAEGRLEVHGSNLKHDVFMENAPHDTAGNIVMKDCPQCNLNYLTLIRIGAQETVYYVCNCSYIASHIDYMKSIGEKIKD